LAGGDLNGTGDIAPSIELIDVRKRFGDVTAVDGLSLRVTRGEFLTLLGPSGCGKTTTLRLIGGFELPTGGEVRIAGEAMGQRPPYRRPVNTVFQHYALFPHRSVAQNVGFGLEMAGVAERERRRRVTEILELVRLPGLEHRRPAELSGGQRQRVAFARALVNRPAVLLLDEPLGALDLTLRQTMQQELKRLNREVGTTFVYVTHDQAEALTMSDRIAVMNAGRLLQLGTPEELYERPRDRFVAGFVGETNFLEATVLRVIGEEAEVDVAGAGQLRVRLSAGSPPDGRATLAVRPEQLALAADVPRDRATEWNALEGTVDDVAYLGGHSRYLVRLPTGGMITVRRQNRVWRESEPTPGEPIRVVFDPAAATLLAP